MAQKFKNDARALLATPVAIGDTSIVLEAGFGDLFPVADMGVGTAGDWFKVTLEKETGEKEIVKVRTRASGSDILSNVLRAQEGTSALAFDSATTVVGLRLTADDIQRTLEVDWSAIPEEDLAAVSSNKTLTLDCRGQHVDTDDASVTIPAGVFSKGDLVVLYNNSAATRSVIAGAGVTLRWDGGVSGNRTLERYGLCTVFCVATNVFRITGAGVS